MKVHKRIKLLSRGATLLDFENDEYTPSWWNRLITGEGFRDLSDVDYVKLEYLLYKKAEFTIKGENNV